MEFYAIIHGKSIVILWLCIQRRRDIVDQTYYIIVI